MYESEEDEEDLQSNPFLGRWVNVYEVGRYYGGPEEGGWWYDAGVPWTSIHCHNKEEADQTLKLMREKYPRTGHRYSMAPRGDDYEVRIEYHFAKTWPEVRPHYE